MRSAFDMVMAMIMVFYAPWLLRLIICPKGFTIEKDERADMWTGCVALIISN